MIQKERILRLNDRPAPDGEYVLYWMQQSQRAVFNPALEFAIREADQRGLPLLVAFGLTDGYPEANLRHYRFLIEGLADAQKGLAGRGIRMVVQRDSPDAVAVRLAERASLVVCDRGYLRHQRAWRDAVARESRCPVIQVESDVVVPVETASDKREFAARTLRPKILRELDRFLVDLKPASPARSSLHLKAETVPLEDVDRVLDSLRLDRSVPGVQRFFRGGTTEALRTLRGFLRNRFGDYAVHRNRPETDDVSRMSMYLHYGQISPVQIALEIGRAKGTNPENARVFLEEMVVRRELAMNFVFHCPDYDRYESLPEWSRKTLAEHREDPRPYRYTREQLESARTHDPYWNAAMKEMRYTGYMHNYMRMYWGKKFIEWTNTPEYGFRLLREINNRYFLDGRDANSFANVGWVFGLHDRPFGEREVFGKVRTMTASGLERKCDIRGYVRKVGVLVSESDSEQS